MVTLGSGLMKLGLLLACALCGPYERQGAIRSSLCAYYVVRVNGRLRPALQPLLPVRLAALGLMSLYVSTT
ncbi:hypothetical protein BDW60DRAFT_191531 [Aspergillus nidulans var. acristatus]